MAAEQQKNIESTEKAPVQAQEKEASSKVLVEEALKSASGAASGISDAAKSVGKAAADALPSMSIQDGAKNQVQDGKNQIQDGSKQVHDDKQIMDSIKNHMNDKIGDKIDMKDLQNKIGDFFKQKDGVEKVPTGDYIVREDGKQTLFTPNGDSIAINPDGSNTIKGDVNKVSTDKYGETTVEFKDGSKVSFDENGFTTIQRDNSAVHFGRHFPHPPVMWGGGIMHGAKELDGIKQGGGMMQIDKDAIKQGLDAAGKALKGN